MADELVTGDPPVVDPPVSDPPPGDPPVADPPVADPPATDPPAADPPENDGGDLFQYFEQAFGDNSLRTKYGGDPAKALAGLYEASRKVGERDDDAVLARNLKDRLGTDGLQSLLDATPKAKNGLDFTAEQLEAWQAQIDTGKAPQKVVDQYTEAQAAVTRAVVQLATKPEAFVRQLIEPHLTEMQKMREELEQRVTSTQQVSQRDAWMQKNAKALYNNGDPAAGFSPTAVEAGKIHDSHPSLRNLPAGSVERMSLALELAQAKAPKAQPTKPVNPNAVRTPALGAGATDLPTVRDLVFKGKPIAEVTKLLAEGKARLDD